MNVFMIRNADGEYYCSYKRNPRQKWGIQTQASIWQSKGVAMSILKKCHLKGSSVIEFEMKELNI